MPRCARAASALPQLLLGLFLCSSLLSSLAAAATCPANAFTCALGYGPASPLTPCTTCDATECCKSKAKWSTLTPSPSYTLRQGHGSVVVNGELLVIAGTPVAVYNPAGPYLNDVWVSATGTSWTQRTAAAAFSPRAWFGTALLGSTVFVVAGQNTVDLQDVWGSTNAGASFTLLTATPGFVARDSFGLVAFNNQLVLVAGFNNVSLLNDIWTSTTGTAWSKITPVGAIFSPRYGFGLVNYLSKIWLVAGKTSDTTLTNDVWVTSDLTNWVSVPQVGPVPPVDYFALVVFNQQMWLCGGDLVANVLQATTTCYASAEGATWVSQVPLPVPLDSFQAVNWGAGVLTTAGTMETALASAQYYLTGVPVCGTFTCPANLQTLSSSTVCAGATCTTSDCCSSSLGARSTKILVIVLAVPTTAFTPVTFAAAAATATGLQQQSIVVTAMMPSSLTIYVAVVGTSPALADAGLALILQAALAGTFGPVVTVYLTDTPFPPPTTYPTYPTYPTVPIFRVPSTSNPALLALLTLLVIPLAICLGLICSYARRPTCMPTCGACPGQAMMMA